MQTVKLALSETGVRLDAFKKSYVVCISYPCSGRNWVQNIMESYLPNGVYFTHDILNDDDQNKYTWRYIKRYSENPMRDLHNAFYANRAIILITRDPRDTVCSYFYQKKYREPHLVDIGVLKDFEAGSFDGSIEDFIKSDVFGIRSTVEFLNLWAPEVKDGSLHITYEQMHRNATETMLKLINYAHFPVDLNWLKQCLEHADFNKRKGWDRGQYGDDERTYKYRKGKIGSYRDELSGEIIAYMNTVIDEHLDPYFKPYYGSG